MKFMFVGNPTARDSANEVTMFGITFPMRVPVEVTNAHAIAKLGNNAHFVAVNDGAPPQEEPKAIEPVDAVDSPVVAPEADPVVVADAVADAFPQETGARRARKAK